MEHPPISMGSVTPFLWHSPQFTPPWKTYLFPVILPGGWGGGQGVFLSHSFKGTLVSSLSG